MGTIQGSKNQEWRILEVTLEAVCDSCRVIESCKGSNFCWQRAKTSAEIVSSATSWQQALIPSKLICLWDSFPYLCTLLVYPQASSSAFDSLFPALSFSLSSWIVFWSHSNTTSYQLEWIMFIHTSVIWSFFCWWFCPWPFSSILQNKLWKAELDASERDHGGVSKDQRMSLTDRWVCS